MGRDDREESMIEEGTTLGEGRQVWKMDGEVGATYLDGSMRKVWLGITRGRNDGAIERKERTTLKPHPLQPLIFQTSTRSSFTTH